MHNAAQAYLQTQVTTTSQGDILVMLYDGAINFLNSAKERIAAKDPAGKGILISRALDVLNELDSTLNMEKGGDLAKNLHSLYDFCSRRLLMANLRQSPEIIDEVLKVLGGLRGAYAQILNDPAAQLAAEEAGKRAAQGGRTQSAPSVIQETPKAAPGMGRHAASFYNRQKMEDTPAEADAARSLAPAGASAPESVVPAAAPVAVEQKAPAPAAPAANAGQSGGQTIGQSAGPNSGPNSGVVAPASGEPGREEASAAPMPPPLTPRSAAGLSLYRKFAGA